MANYIIRKSGHVLPDPLRTVDALLSQVCSSSFDLFAVLNLVVPGVMESVLISYVCTSFRSYVNFSDLNVGMVASGNTNRKGRLETSIVIHGCQ